MEPPLSPSLRAPGLPDLPPTPDQPGYSILLNGPTSRPRAPSSVSTLHSPVTGPSPPSPTASTNSFTSEAFTDASTSLSATAPSSGSCKIRFAPLPQVPPELKRRSSITLGVAARKNLLSQGGGGAGPRAGAGAGGTRVIQMNDQDWEEYKRKFETGGGAVDLGQVAKQSARSLWRRVRSASQSSSSSTTSASASTSSVPLSSPRRLPRNPIRGPSDPCASPPSFPAFTTGLDVLREHDQEDDHAFSEMSLRSSSPGRAPPHLRPEVLGFDDGNFPQHGGFSLGMVRRRSFDGGAGDGDTTPRRRASPPPRLLHEQIQEEVG